MDRSIVGKGKLSGILAAGALSGLILGVAIYGVTYTVAARGALDPPSYIGTFGMGLTGVVLAASRRYALARNKVFSFHQSADEGSAMSIGADWVFAMILSPAFVSVAMPELSRILWRLPLAIFPVGALIYFLWLLLFKPFARAFAGMSRQELVGVMAGISLRDELGILADKLEVRFDDGTLYLTGSLRNRDLIKDARQAVLGIPYVGAVDSEGIKREA